MQRRNNEPASILRRPAKPWASCRLHREIEDGELRRTYCNLPKRGIQNARRHFYIHKLTPADIYACNCNFEVNKQRKRVKKNINKRSMSRAPLNSDLPSVPHDYGRRCAQAHVTLTRHSIGSMASALIYRQVKRSKRKNKNTKEQVDVGKIFLPRIRDQATRETFLVRARLRTRRRRLPLDEICI